MYSSFDRSAGGNRSLSEFHDVDIIFYIEGKNESEDCTKLYDYQYYKTILSKVCNIENFKITVLGCKPALLDKGRLIENNNITNNYIIIDRDHDDFISHNSMNANVFKKTHGYSWENDFFTTGIIRYYLNLTSADNGFLNSCIGKIKRVEKRISYIHKANLVLRMNGKNLFSMKSGCGCQIENSLFHGVSISEVKRIISKIKDEMNVNDFTSQFKTIKDIHNGLAIQGHSFEFFILKIIDAEYQNVKIGNSSMVDKNLIKNILFIEFSKNPLTYLSPQTVSYYQSIFC